MKEDIDKKISLRITGPAMDVNNGYELKYLLGTLYGFETIIEKTYLFSSGRMRMSEDDKNNLKIIISNPRKGSFNAELGILLYNSALALTPIVVENGPAIWSAVKQTYEYLKVVIDSKKKGEKVTMNNSGDGQQTLIVGDNNKVYQFPSYVPELAEKIAPELAKITNNINKGKIESINFSDNKTNENIILDAHDKERFATKTYLTSDTYVIKGQIVTANSKSYTGKILIFENDHNIAPGEYSFSVDPQLANNEYFKEKYLVEEEYICRLKIRLDPSKGLEEVIVGMNIISSDNVA